MYKDIYIYNMPYYVVELNNYNMGIIEASSLQSARVRAIRSEGINNISSVREATNEDISYFESMGGRKIRND